MISVRGSGFGVLGIRVQECSDRLGCHLSSWRKLSGCSRELAVLSRVLDVWWTICLWSVVTVILILVTGPVVRLGWVPFEAKAYVEAACHDELASKHCNKDSGERKTALGMGDSRRDIGMILTILPKLTSTA